MRAVLPRRRHRNTEPRVHLAVDDPYLGFLLRTQAPELDVVVVAPDDDHSTADLVIAGPGEVEPVRGTRLLCVTDERASERPRGADAVLLRPIDPGELRRTLRLLLGLDPVPADPGARLRMWPRLARIAAVIIAGIAEMTAPDPDPVRVALAVVLLAYSTGRLVRRTDGPRAAVGDVLVGGAVLLATGGLASNFVGFALMVSLEGGIDLGTPYGAAAGTAVAFGGLPGAYAAIAAGRDPRELIAALALFPLTALTGLLVRHVMRPEGADRTRLLSEANDVLGTLHRIAQAVPGGFDARHVAHTILGEVRATVGSPAGVILRAQAGGLAVLDAYGTPGAEGIVLAPGAATGRLDRGVRVSRLTDLAAPLRVPLGAHPTWLEAPLAHQGRILGVLLVATEGAPDEATRLVVQHLADETAVGFENARLFTRVQELSADEERQRIARELHDGVAQSLAHVHIELGYLARHADEPSVRTETVRLARVVDRALSDVRSTIAGLRSPHAGAGLAGALGAHVRDLRGMSGPEIRYRVTGEPDLPAEVAAEMFRVGQEALSNAVRHAGADRVDVELDASPVEVVLRVTDDGHGMDPDAPAGIGLAAMQERARRIGACLTVSGEPGGGVAVALTWRPHGMDIEGPHEAMLR